MTQDTKAKALLAETAVAMLTDPAISCWADCYWSDPVHGGLLCNFSALDFQKFQDH